MAANLRRQSDRPVPFPALAAHLGNADMIQPGLIPLQPNLDFMDTFEPFQGEDGGSAHGCPVPLPWTKTFPFHGGSCPVGRRPGEALESFQSYFLVWWWRQGLGRVSGPLFSLKEIGILAASEPPVWPPPRAVLPLGSRGRCRHSRLPAVPCGWRWPSRSRLAEQGPCRPGRAQPTLVAGACGSHGRASFCRVPSGAGGALWPGVPLGQVGPSA